MVEGTFYGFFFLVIGRLISNFFFHSVSFLTVYTCIFVIRIILYSLFIEYKEMLSYELPSRMSESFSISGITIHNVVSTLYSTSCSQCIHYVYTLYAQLKQKKSF